MEIYSIIRKLAKSDYYQSVFSSSEKGLRLFENNIEFTPIQMFFLSYLNFYSNLYTKVYMGEVDERVLEDTIYEDSFTYYEKDKKKKEKNKKRVEIQPQKQNDRKETRTVSSSTWIFKSKNK